MSDSAQPSATPSSDDQALAQWEPVPKGRTWRVMRYLPNGRVQGVMRPGVGAFKSKHLKVFMTIGGALETCNDLNRREGTKQVPLDAMTSAPNSQATMPSGASDA